MKAAHLITAVLALFLVAASAHAQKATEIYIPIGKSPGLSGKHTAVGFIQTVDMETMTMTIAGGTRNWTVKMDHDTAIYLDRSSYRMKNLYGTEDDCKVGLLCEVKYVGGTRPEGVTCEWIKIQPIDPRPPLRQRSRRR